MAKIRKYTEVMKDKHTRMSKEDIIEMRSFLGEFEKDCDKALNKASAIALLDEVEYLRSVLGDAYLWLGVKPPTNPPRSFSRTMKVVAEVHREVKA